jgi:uncharacterized membrane protein
MASLIVAALFFIAIHLGVSGTTVRDAIVARLGLRAYMVIFSLASLAGMIGLVSAYKAAPYLPTWGMLEWWKPVAIALMLPAFVLVVVGLATPNPTSVAQEKLVDVPPQGILRITRHPFLMGVALWSLVHLVGNGDWASALLFGALFIVAAAGPASIDAKRRRALGAHWDGFARQTSILPFAAIMSGRNHLVLTELWNWRPLAGVLAYILMLGGHAHIVGVSPWPGH